MDDEKIYRMFLCGVPGLFYEDQMRLYDAFGSFKSIYAASELNLRMNIDGRQHLIDSFLKLRSERDPAREYDSMLNKGIRFTSIDDPEYPERLRRIPEPPMGVFHIGQIPHDDCPSIAIIGSRACSNYGKEMSLKFAKDLSKAGFDIISGMAVGIDGYSHRGALNVGGRTSAVLGSGVDVCYPEGNRDVYERLKECGTILSEYYPGTPPLHVNFPRRNRIISGLSDAILVIEAKEKSGTLITVDQGLEQGKDIFAVPGKITDTMSAGCNDLILRGASIALSAANIIEEMAPKYGISFNSKRVNLRRSTGTERVEKKSGSKTMKEMNINQRIYSALSFDPATPEEIATAVSADIRDVLGVLTLLELDGRCRRIGLSSFVRCE